MSFQQDRTVENTTLLKDLMKWAEEQKIKLKNQTQQLAEFQKHVRPCELTNELKVIINKHVISSS